MNLLFHCCCAPCSAGCLESLAAEGIAPTLFWFNPNIHPYTEYISRRDALAGFAAARGLTLEIAGEYGLRSFLQGLYAAAEGGSAAEGSPAPEAPERCGYCYRLRLERAASFAAEKGFDAFSTSLLVSPYQQHERIRRIGEELAERYGVNFFYRDFRPLFREGQAAARSLGLYMQKYCGCIFSEEERYAKPAQKTGAAVL